MHNIRPYDKYSTNEFFYLPEQMCELPILSENTQVSPNKTKFSIRERLRFECTPGNRLFSDYDTVMCQRDGTFSRSVPTCDSQTCKEATLIENGTPVAEDISKEGLQEFPIGTYMKYECVLGYRLSVNGQNPTGRISCLPTGQWESNVPACEPITCEAPLSIVHGSFNGHERGFLDRVIYECDPGYILSGDNTVECLKEGLWEPAPPACSPVDCGFIGTLDNGVIRSDSQIYQSVATYLCNNGYELVGSSENVCTENGSWSSSSPLCRPVMCGMPETIANGRFLPAAYTYGTSVAYVCLAGYVNAGATERLCGADGTWSNELPNCIRRECNAPPIVINSDANDNKYLFGDTLSYTCRLGYMIQGRNLIECLEDGSWTVELPTCALVECQQLPDVDNGVSLMIGNTFDSKVEYTCDEGYELIGDAVRVCQSEGEWSSDAPTCHPLSCLPPGDIENSSLDFKDLTLGSIVMYECNIGYDSIGGDLHRRCLSDMTWSGSDPECVPLVCDAPPNVENGYVVGTNFSFMATVTFICDEGYRLSANEVLTCNEDGYWSENVPTCQIIVCESPSTVTSNGRMIGSDYSFGAIIRYECDAGYNLVGSETRSCMANAEWDGPIPLCEVVHCPRPILRNGFPSTFQTEYATQVTFSCQSPRVLFGTAERICLANATWSGTSPKCIRCDPTTTTPAIRVSVKGKIATYTCPSDHILKGDNVLTCQEDGSWLPAPPLCESIGCGEITQSLLSGTINKTGTGFDAIAEYTCNLGYRRLGPANRKCHMNGTWSEAIPICLINFCPIPVVPTNGRKIGNGIIFNSTVSFSCDEGYILEGSSKRTCMDNRKWSGEDPVCVISMCPALIDNEFENGVIEISSNAIGSKAIYKCNVGYILNGSSFRTCEVSGIWSEYVPICEIISCEHLIIPNGRVIGDDRTFGSTVTIECNEDYYRTGFTQLSCESDGQWTTPLPVCVLHECEPLSNDTFLNVYIETPSLGYQIRSEVKYICDIGYRLEGNNTRVCTANNTWQGAVPICSQVVCSRYGTVFNHGTVQLPQNNVYLSIMTFECNTGYSLLGQSIIHCQENGTWSNEFPVCDLIRCPSTNGDTITNGVIQGTENTFGSTVEYICDTGYTIFGTNTRICNQNGRWSGQSPFCQIVTCESLDAVSDGQFLANSQTFDSRVNYECDDRYKLVGVHYRVCQENGKWSEEAPKCVLKTCDPLVSTEFTDGHIVASSNEIGSTAIYHCNHGYKLNGVNSRTCSNDESWTDIQPRCIQIICPPVVNIEHGRVSGSQSVFGSVLEFECNEGHTLVGSTSISCKDNGEWSSHTPMCFPITCGEPPDIENGKRSFAGVLYSNVVTYSCNVGFTLNNTPTRVCLKTGLWSESAQECVKIECHSPEEVTDASLDNPKAVYYYGDRISFTCNERYSLHGSRKRTCLDTRAWSGANPVCVISACPPLNDDDFANGVIQITNHSVGAKSSYRCNTGYMLIGNTFRICENSGIWSEDVPRCEIISCEQLHIQNGRVVGDDRTFGSTVTIECNEDYYRTGLTQLSCESDGQWTAPLPVCVLHECEPLSNDTFLNGYIETPSLGNQIRSTVTYRCNIGYRLEGNNNRVCTANDTWQVNAPICVQVVCPAYSTIFDHGTVQVPNNYVYMSTMKFECNTGYSLLGQSTIHCQENGTWSSTFPVCELIRCPSINESSIINGVIRNTENTFGLTVEYICNTGYTLYGENTRICNQNGRWSGHSPICQIVTCEGLDPVPDGQFLANSQTFGSRVNYECDDRYKLVGVHYRVCQENGKWSEEAPKCVLKTCDPLVSTEFTDGHIVASSNEIGSTAIYHCNHGYKLNGVNSRTCSNDESWTDIQPRCIQIICPPVVNIEHGRVSGSQSVFGSVLEFECNEGHTLVGSTSISCKDNGEWSSHTPMCFPITCGEPPDIENGKRSFAGVLYSNVVTYSCNVGFTLNNTPTRVCLKTGLWSESAQECVKIECHSPEEVTDASLDNPKAVYYYGDRISFTCNERYSLHGSRKRTCLDTRAWSGANPVCVISACPPLNDDDFANGVIQITNHSVGAKSSYRCNTGYMLIGNTFRICENSGIWSEDVPRCEIISCEQLHIQNGRVVGDDRTFGSTVTIECNEDYYRTGLTQLSCESDGQWTAPLPVCVLHECEPLSNDTFLNGYIETPSLGNQIRSTVTYRCNIGYRLEGNNNRVCTANDTWQVNAPICVQVVCPAYSTIFDHGTVQVPNNYVYMSTMKFECNTGYSLLGQSTIHCQENGTWSSTFPVCELIRCPSINESSIINGVIRNTENTFGLTVEYICNTGYTLYGENTRICNQNGQWSGQSPSCLIVLCGVPIEVSNGGYVSNGQMYGARANYSCANNYKLVGDNYRLCDANGQWSGQSPTCVLKTCDALVTTEFTNGYIDVSSNDVGAIATYKCNHGYKLTGASSRTCSDNESWTNIQPVCIQIVCPNVVNIDHGSVFGSRYVFSSVLEFECDEGHNMVGNSTVSCEENGEWSSAFPTCFPTSCGEPPDIENGLRTYADVVYSSVVTYSCSAGYVLNNAPTRVCLSTRVWSGIAPECVRIICPSPGKIPNATFDNAKDLYYVGDRIMYICDNGFYLKADTPARLCLYTTKWSGQQPECIKFKCRIPRPPKNGRILRKNQKHYEFGDVVEIECNTGYRLSGGTTSRTCQANRRWTFPVPRCTQITCDDVPRKSNSDTMLLNGTTLYSSHIKIKCLDGFINVGSESNEVLSQCLDTGQWSEFAINCSKVMCETLPTIAYSNAFPHALEKHYHGDDINVICAEGFSLVGKSQIGCRRDGSWDMENIPSCIINTCGIPPSIENGSYEGITLTFGSEIIYSCNEFFTIEGTGRIQCTSDGTWSPSAPTCNLIVCTSPPEVTNAHITNNTVGEQFRLGDFINYDCDLGYVIVNIPSITCSMSSDWTGELPVCSKVRCATPPHVFNGDVTYSDTSFSNRAVYMCSVGFELKGEGEIVCNANGEWDNAAPICDPVTCEDPPYVRHSGTLGELFTFGNILTYYCENGYSMTGNDILECLSSGKWSHAAPKCVPISCGKPPVIANGILTGTSYLFKDEVVYECINGYEHTGDNTLICSANSQWVGTGSECLPIDCGPPPVLSHATTLVSGTTYGSVINHMCNPGYLLQGDPIVKCSANGEWQHDDSTKCLPVDCGLPAMIDHAYNSVSGTHFPNNVTYSCHAGYRLLSDLDTHLVCGIQGLWEGNIPVCVSKGCISPPLNANLHITKADFSVGGIVTYTCDEGYILVGNSLTMCQQSGIWSSPAPECQRKYINLTISIWSCLCYSNIQKFHLSLAVVKVDTVMRIGS